jgi:OmpA-OmpF porin, OOP family
MRSIFISSVAVLTAIAAPAISRADEQGVANRFYGGMSLGASRFDLSDDHGSVFKLYGGYQITENFGAEVGYLRTGDITRDSQTAKSQALYTAGTARWQFSDRFSVSSALGMAYGQVKDDTATGAANLNDKNLSLMVGLGAQYRLTPRTELTLNVDHLGKLTERVSTDVVTAGVVMRF